MQKCTAGVVLGSALLMISEVCAAQTGPAWQEDLRRCLIAKPIHGGRVVIANDQGKLTIDVQRPQDESETAKYVITFDDGRSINSAPEDNAQGSYPHVLGTYASIAPRFSNSRTLAISITAPNKPNDEIRVSIGNGAKAMAFLKHCEDYWRRYHTRPH
jgi:hypothetical protein